jgi:hypothetical protein
MYQGVATRNDATTREILVHRSGPLLNFGFTEFYEVRMRPRCAVSASAAPERPRSFGRYDQEAVRARLGGGVPRLHQPSPGRVAWCPTGYAQTPAVLATRPANFVCTELASTGLGKPCS